MGLDIVRNVVNVAKNEGRFKLLEHEAYEVLRVYGLPVPKAVLVRDPDEAADYAERIGYPVVLKVVSPDISHKSDVGGVVLNLKSPVEVREAFTGIRNNVSKLAPNSRVYGILVQEMVPDGLEVIVGSTRDPVFGHLIVFGLGGIFVEVLRDVSFRITPLTPQDAESMIDEIKSAKILEGYRGQPPKDRKALVDIILKLARFVEDVGEVKDVDLNPVMLYDVGKGAKIADARIILG